MTRRSAACGLTLEFSRSRKRAKPAVAIRLERRVRPCAPASGTLGAMAAKHSESCARGDTVDVRPRGPRWRWLHSAKATDVRFRRQELEAAGPAENGARRGGRRELRGERCEPRDLRSAGNRARRTDGAARLRCWRVEGPCGLTFELTRGRRLAEPAVGRRVQRRVSPQWEKRATKGHESVATEIAPMIHAATRLSNAGWSIQGPTMSAFEMANTKK